MQLGLGRLTRRVRLGAKLALAAGTATTVVLAATLFVTTRLSRRQLLDVVAEASSNQSDTLRVVLEAQMTAADLTLLRRLVNDIGHQPNIAWVAVLNNEGRVRISSDPRAIGNLLDKSSPECGACHERNPGNRLRSVTLLRPAGDVLRTVTPILNLPVCQSCHGTVQRLNGKLIIDRSLAPVQKAILSSRLQVIAGGAAAMLVLLLSLGFAVERLVLARMRRLRDATRALGEGNLRTRSSDSSSDELGDLVRDFNAMAEGLEAALAGITVERQLSRTDALTGLANARSFDEAIEQEVARIGRRPAPVSILFFDLDHFKALNDSRGHLAGNELLRLVGETVRASVRVVDTAARVGGDEFAVLLPDTGAEACQRVVERLREHFVRRTRPAGFATTLSLGAVTFNGAPSSARELLAAADRAMYEVKKRTRDGVHYETQAGQPPPEHRRSEADTST